jgi:transaldolase
MYERVADAYLRGLERRQQDGSTLDVASVASFFVSRVDTSVDERLAADGHPELRGAAAIANARLAYRSFERLFSGPRWQALESAGARVQRPLWASTGVKNPDYRDTIYVEELVGPQTISTMPPQTLAAVADHGQISPDTVRVDPEPALGGLRDAGIDLRQVTDDLLTAGIAQFQRATDDLLAGIEKRRQAQPTG